MTHDMHHINGTRGDVAANRRYATSSRLPVRHLIVSGAKAGAIAAILGTKDIPELSLTSPTLPGVTHKFTNLETFNNKVSNARIAAGCHWRFSTVVGSDMGWKIGTYTVKNCMQPLKVAVQEPTANRRMHTDRLSDTARAEYAKAMAALRVLSPRRQRGRRVDAPRRSPPAGRAGRPPLSPHCWAEACRTERATKRPR
jgi:hypothetical protein